MAKKAKRNFSCDLETTTDPNDCRVWAYGWMEVGNEKNYNIGNNLDDLMTFFEKEQGNFYFHNLKFDGSFILNWLHRNGFDWSKNGEAKTYQTTISDMGQWYKIDITYGYKGNNKRSCTIYDSLKKIPFPVRVIGKAYGLNVLKGDIDYREYRPVGHVITPTEYEYIKNDIMIVAKALAIQFDQGMTGMTAGKDSLDGYKAVINSKSFKTAFPILEKDIDDRIRKFYKGGFTYVNEKYRNRTIGEGIVLDVNSQYPAQMYDKPLPYGTPKEFTGQYKHDSKYPLYLQEIRVAFEVKKDHIPTIQIKDGSLGFGQNEYIKSSDYEMVTLYLTSVEMELFENHYDIDAIEYVGGYKFKQSTNMFKDFINKWMYVKENSEGAIRELAKLMLNSLYGKFATNPKITGKIPYFENGVLKFKLPRDEETGEVIHEYKDPVYTAMGAFITAYARRYTIETAQKVYHRFAYADTDSIHLEGLDIPDELSDLIHKSKLGYWDHEATYQEAKYIRQKTYCYNIILNKPKLVFNKTLGRVIETNMEFKVKCAGMTPAIKKKMTFKKFKIGYTTPTGKLKPRQVKGGVVLEDVVFTLKEATKSA